MLTYQVAASPMFHLLQFFNRCARTGSCGSSVSYKPKSSHYLSPRMTIKPNTHNSAQLMSKSSHGEKAPFLNNAALTMAMGRLRHPITPEYLSAFRTYSRSQPLCGGHFYIFKASARPSLVTGNYSEGTHVSANLCGARRLYHHHYRNHHCCHRRHHQC